MNLSHIGKSLLLALCLYGFKVNAQQSFSEIDIPVRIGLKPFYDWANKFIDTVYTSDKYPNEWMQDGCDTRYQYRFIRGPFKFKTYNNLLLINFLGYYQLKGSTRICSGNSSYSPWTPPCGCGYGNEKMRRIDAGFVVKFDIHPDYTVGLIVQTIDPIPLDKCEVCFFGKDITKTVVQQMKASLVSSISDMQVKMRSFSLRPYMQVMWDTLQAGYRLPGLGYLNFQPEKIRMSQLLLRSDTLYCSLGLSAKPSLSDTVITLKKLLPNLSDFSFKNGFQINTQLHLPYDSLNILINNQIGGTTVQMGKGLLKKTVRIDSVLLSGSGAKTMVQAYLSKGIKGVVYLEGLPNWNASAGEFRVDSLDFHIQTKQFLLKTASWLFDGTIEKKIKEACRFQLADKLKAMQYAIIKKMNQPVYAGIQSKGFISQLNVDNIVPYVSAVDLNASAAGKLFLDIDGASILKQFIKL